MKDIKVGNNIVIENVSEEKIAFRYFNVNFVEILEPGDKVILTPNSSEAVAYYAALDNDNMGINVEAIPVNNEVVEPTEINEAE